MTYTREQLSRYTFDTVEGFYREGRISADDWEWYCYHWRNSAPRFSSLCEGYQDSAYAGMSYDDVRKA